MLVVFYEMFKDIRAIAMSCYIDSTLRFTKLLLLTREYRGSGSVILMLMSREESSWFYSSFWGKYAAKWSVITPISETGKSRHLAWRRGCQNPWRWFSLFVTIFPYLHLISKPWQPQTNVMQEKALLFSKNYNATFRLIIKNKWKKLELSKSGRGFQEGMVFPSQDDFKQRLQMPVLGETMKGHPCSAMSWTNCWRSPPTLRFSQCSQTSDSDFLVRPFLVVALEKILWAEQGSPYP